MSPTSDGGAAKQLDDPRPGRRLLLSDFKRAFQRFQRDQMTDRAAALTYYSLLSLFPALLFGVAALGYFGGQALIADAADYLRQAGAPAETVDAVTKALESAQAQRSTAFTALIVALGTSLYGASGAFGAVGRALNVVWRVDEGRNFIRRKAHDVFWTAVLLVLVLITFVLIFVGGEVAQDLLGTIGLGGVAGDVWLIARWPAALLFAMVIYAVVYYAAPNVEVPRFQFLTPGAVVGVVAWIIVSAGFFLYVSSFSSYSATYGAFAAAVILVVWLWLTNVVLLLGAELNAAIDLRRSPELPPTYDGPPLPEKVPADV
jgi:membrane protein